MLKRMGMLKEWEERLREQRGKMNPLSKYKAQKGKGEIDIWSVAATESTEYLRYSTYSTVSKVPIVPIPLPENTVALKSPSDELPGS